MNSDIFKPVQSKKLLRSCQKKVNLDDESIAESVNDIIQDMYSQPLMVAYSSLVNDDVRKKCKEAGFQVVIENPLNVKDIKDQILSNLE